MPELIVKLGDNIVQKYFFFQEPLTIGRSPDNEIVIENLAISRNHASIKFENGHYFISDLDSSNGTFVNGVKIKKTEIMDKDVVTIGKHKVYFYDQRTAEVVRQPSFQDNDATMVVAPSIDVYEGALIVCKGRQKGQRYKLNPNGTTTVGRGNDNDIRMTDWFVSKAHAQLEQRENKFFVKDLGSWRHTFVNGEAVQEAPIKHGDLIQLGPTVELRFEVVPSEAAANARIPENMERSVFQAAPRQPVADSLPAEPNTTAERDLQQIHGTNGSGAQQGNGSQPIPAEPATTASHGVQAPEEPRDETSSLPLENLNLEAAFPGEATPVQGFPIVPPPAQAEEAYATSQYTFEAVQEASPSPLVAAPAAPDDHAEAVYEQIAEASLIAAAGVATPAPEKSAPAAKPDENRVDTSAAPSNDRSEPAATPAVAQGSAPESEVQMWERALQNKSQAIRKQAARRLKQLTGKDYDY